MNEQLNAALAALITKANKGIDQGVSFLSAQLPDVIHQLLIWNILSSLLLMLVGMSFAGVATRIVFWLLRRAKAETYFDLWNYAPLLCLIAILWFIAFAFFCNCWDWLEILVAPKIYLLQFAHSLK